MAPAKTSGKRNRQEADQKQSTDVDLYLVLGIEKSASVHEIKKSYYKLALQHHPDRNLVDSKEKTQLFQQISLAYEVLSSPDRRERYDRTGSYSEQLREANWAEYFKELFHKVSLNELDIFKSAYVGSAEELEDVLAAYIQCNGDLAQIAETVFFGDAEQEERYRKMIDRALARGIMKKISAYQKIVSDEKAYQLALKQRKRRMAKEAVEAEELAKGLGISKEVDLTKAIQSRRGRFDTFISNLEEKYGNMQKASKKNKKK